MFKKHILISAGIIFTSTQAFSAQGLNVMTGQNLSATAGTVYNLQAGPSGIFTIRGGQLNIEDNVTITTVGTAGMYNDAAALLVTNDSGYIAGGNGTVIIVDTTRSGLLFNAGAINSLVELGNDVNITTAKGVGIFLSGSNDSHVFINDGLVLNSGYIGVATTATDNGALINLNGNAKINTSSNAFNILGSNGKIYIGQGSDIKSGLYAFNLSGTGNIIDVNGSTVEGGSRGFFISGENHEVNINNSNIIIGVSSVDADGSVVVLGGINNIVNINDSSLFTNGNQVIRFGNSGANTSQDGLVVNVKNTEITKQFYSAGDFSTLIKLTGYNNQEKSTLYQYTVNLDNSTITLDSSDLIYTMINSSEDASISNGSSALININNVRVGGSDNAYLAQFGSVASSLSETDLVLNLSGTDATTFAKGILNNDQSNLELNLTNSKINGDVVNSASSQGEMIINATDGSSFTGNVYALNEDASINAATAYTSVSLDNSVWNLNGDSHVVSLTNGGIVNFIPSSTPGVLLTVHGNYQGNNGLLSLNTQLGDDNSLTDKLIVEGNTSGNTRVQIVNAGGSGAQTLNGIEVIRVNGQSDGEFVQAGRIVAGAYDYTLGRGIEADTVRNWYLTSKSQDEQSDLRPEAGAYNANLVAANNLFVTRLHDRLGETQYIDALTGEHKVTSMWLRNEGGHNRVRDESGQLRTQSNRYVLQLGGDIAQWSNNGADRFHLGLMAGYGDSKSNTTSRLGYDAKGAIDGYSVGAYSTWYANEADKSGLYVDGWLQYSWFDNTVTGQEQTSEHYKSKGFTASIESGYTFKLGESVANNMTYFIQPKAQVTWMGVKADDHIESNGSNISGQGDGNIQTRLGIKAFINGYHEQDKGKDRVFQPFVEANWIYNSKDFGTYMDGISVKQDGAANIAELKVGVEGQINKQVNLWGNVAQQIGNNGYSDTAVMLGAKYNF